MEKVEIVNYDHTQNSGMLCLTRLGVQVRFHRNQLFNLYYLL